MSYIFGYGRSSTDKQQITCHKQKEIVEAAADLKMAIEDGWVYAGFFADRAVSSTIPFLERPEGQRIFLSASRGDLIIVSHLDRIFRSVIDCGNTLETLNEAGIGISMLDAQVDTTTPVGKACLQMIAVMKQLEREEISRRTREAKQWKKSQGLPTGANAPWGWYVKGKKAEATYQPDPHSRKVSEYAIYLWDQLGLSGDQIALRFIKEGVCHSKRTVQKGKPITTRDTVKHAYMAGKLDYPIAPRKELSQLFKDAFGALPGRARKARQTTPSLS